MFIFNKISIKKKPAKTSRKKLSKVSLKQTFKGSKNNKINIIIKWSISQAIFIDVFGWKSAILKWSCFIILLKILQTKTCLFFFYFFFSRLHKIKTFFTFFCFLANSLFREKWHASPKRVILFSFNDLNRKISVDFLVR